ncbi:MAG: hypothetical protein NWE91_02905 [Candidatus Bathyarchaeota archaeon]|nr:hypothetical protein [Candidatus Bathyarchaeota archaeon]
MKFAIANYEANDSYKRNLCLAYNHYVKFHGLSWEVPRYKPSEKLPKIPTEEKVNMLISVSPFKLAVRLCLSKESKRVFGNTI